MVKCSIHGCQQLDQKGSKSQCYALPKVKPLNDRKTVKAREGKLKAVISNKQRVICLFVRICRLHKQPALLLTN